MLPRTAFSVVFFCKKTKVTKKGKAPIYARITQLTANKYHRLLRYMTEYIRQVYGKEDLPLETIDYAYVDGLNTYMQTAYNCHNNGAVNLLCCVKNFLLYAVRNERIEKNSFRYYKMKIDKTNVKVPLTKAELDLLLKRPMPNERLDRIRDVFCFCALTGLAFTDVDHLRREHFTTDEEGQLWIHKSREKTSVMSRVPVLPQAAALLEKYRDDANCRARGKLLPVPSNTNTNMTRRYSVANISHEMRRHKPAFSLQFVHPCDANRRQPLPHRFAGETFEGRRALSECKLAGIKIHKSGKR